MELLLAGLAIVVSLLLAAWQERPRTAAQRIPVPRTTARQTPPPRRVPKP